MEVRGLGLVVPFLSWPILFLPPPLHHLGDAHIVMGSKLFLYPEQYILKHYMYPRFVSMWSIYFNLGLSAEEKKK